MLRQRVQARLRHRIGGRRRGLDRLLAPHRTDVDDAAPYDLIHHSLRYRLREEKERLVDVVVLMEILARVLEKRRREEITRRIDEIIKRSAGRKFTGKNIHLLPVVKIYCFGGDFR